MTGDYAGGADIGFSSYTPYGGRYFLTIRPDLDINPLPEGEFMFIKAYMKEAMAGGNRYIVKKR
jgi:hypothetical protein